MKKIIALILALLMVLSLAGCAGTTDIHAKSEGTMTYAEYAAAAVESQVVIEGFVQAKQSWWDNKATVYLADKDGAYFVYEMACTEEDYAKLTDGAKIKVTGYKGEWAGEVEIMDPTFELMEGTYVTEAVDATAWLGTDELAAHMNQFVAVNGLTIEPSTDAEGNEVAFLYNWDGSGAQGDDLYFNASVNGNTYNFCVESYLTDSSTDVYKTVEALNIGDAVDLKCFLYWYEGANPHVTSVTVK